MGDRPEAPCHIAGTLPSRGSDSGCLAFRSQLLDTSFHSASLIPLHPEMAPCPQLSPAPVSVLVGMTLERPVLPCLAGGLEPSGRPRSSPGSGQSRLELPRPVRPALLRAAPPPPAPGWPPLKAGSLRRCGAPACPAILKIEIQFCVYVCFYKVLGFLWGRGGNEVYLLFYLFIFNGGTGD